MYNFRIKYDCVYLDRYNFCTWGENFRCSQRTDKNCKCYHSRYPKTVDISINANKYIIIGPWRWIGNAWD
jgi:hypothetical protein